MTKRTAGRALLALSVAALTPIGAGATQDYLFSQHALQRIQQRGIQPEWVETVLALADRRVSVGNSIRAFSLSRKQVRTLHEHGVAEPGIDKAQKVVVLVAEESEKPSVVVSVLRDTEKRSRHYRRPYSRKRMSAF